MAIFSFQHRMDASFLIWTIILILLGRALNIYPLCWFINHFRETRISRKMQFVMWFSGLRGAIAYAVSLHLDIADADQRRTIITTSLCVVLFTILVLGGSTYPLVKWLKVSR
jgi:sodium/hydrogen exchanger 8